jgi:hypothetical protein
MNFEEKYYFLSMIIKSTKKKCEIAHQKENWSNEQEL